MPDTPPILLLDVMDTLVADPFFEAIPRFFEMSLERLLKEKHPDSWIRFEEAKISEQQYMETYFQDGRKVDRDGLRQTLWDTYEWLPGIELLLARLHAAGVEMHAVSNYSIWHRIIEEKLKLSRFVQWTFVSSRTGLRKPDPRCYEFAFQTLGAVAADCVFVDDRQENVDAAAKLGADAILFTSSEQLESDLTSRGLFGPELS